MQALARIGSDALARRCAQRDGPVDELATAPIALHDGIESRVRTIRGRRREMGSDVAQESGRNVPGKRRQMRQKRAKGRVEIAVFVGDRAVFDRPGLLRVLEEKRRVHDLLADERVLQRRRDFRLEEALHGGEDVAEVGSHRTGPPAPGATSMSSRSSRPSRPLRMPTIASVGSEVRPSQRLRTPVSAIVIILTVPSTW